MSSFQLLARIICNRMEKVQSVSSKSVRSSLVITVFVTLLATQFSFGWGKDGHKMINRVAVETLPTNIPAFMRTPQALDEIEYLGPEPDRWRSPAEPELSAAQAPEHFLDLELADMATPNGLPARRFDFIRDLYAAQILHPEMAAKLTPQTVGLLPWQANEVFERLKADMREYRARLAAHTDTYGVEQAVLYDAGWLGHYVADGSQPLHTTINYNGWVEAENPEGFTREHKIHSQFESEFVHNNIKAQDIQPLVPSIPRVLDSPFDDFVAYLRATNQQVPETYRLEKHGGFNGHGTAQSRSFTIERLVAGAAMLRDMIYTAWVQSAQPVPDWHDRAPKNATSSGKPA